MKLVKRLLVVCSLVAVTAGIASAGAKWSIPVHVDLKGKWAIGSLGSARNSADSNQYIGCYMYAVPWMTGPVAVCNANTASNVIVACMAYNNPSVIQVIQSMDADSLVSFGWDDSGNCTSVQTEKFSFYESRL